MGRLFGTDGIRGVAGSELTAQTAFAVGAAAAAVLTESAHRKPVILLGKDSRISSDMLEAVLVAGVTSAGADAIVTGVMPTPAVAYLVSGEADAGIMVSASHNPYEYNGIKIFDSQGYKLPDSVEDEIEALAAKDFVPKTGGGIGRVRYDRQAHSRYVKYILDCAGNGCAGLRVAADCANGSASTTARDLLGALGLAKLDVLHDAPDGVNINAGCGSTHMDALSRHVVEGGFDLGLAFDGDADRCLAVDETGAVVDGDKIMAICALYERGLGFLPGDTVVATVMSNLGFHEWAGKQGLTLEAAKVGDRYVLERMREGGFLLGGEQSGHLIFARHATTGDGQLTALKLMAAVKAAGKPLSRLASEIPWYPQVLVNVTVDTAKRDTAASHPAVLEQVAKAEKVLGSAGRVLVRPSGTEALVRVMIEGKDAAEIKNLAEMIASAVRLV